MPVLPESYKVMETVFTRTLVRNLRHYILEHWKLKEGAFLTRTIAFHSGTLERKGVLLFRTLERNLRHSILEHWKRK